MKFDLHRMSMASWIFIALTIGSVSYLAFSTYDYLNFYPSLAQLQPSTWKISLLETGSGSPALWVEVSVSNPSGSSAFTITNLRVTIFFTNSSSSSNSTYQLFSPGGLLANQDVTQKLAPHSVFNSTIMLALTSSRNDSLMNFTRSNDGRVMAEVTFDADVITFLEPASGRLPLESIDSLPLS